MTCPERGAIHLGVSSPEHMATCAECTAALARLEAARGVLQADLPKFEGPARARVVRGIEARGRNEARLQRTLWAATAAFAMAAVVLIWVRSPSERPAPPAVAGVDGDDGDDGDGDGDTPGAVDPPRMEQALALEAGARAVAGSAGISAVRSAALSVLTTETIRLDEGAVWIDVAPRVGAAFRVETPFARIEVISTRFLVDVTRERTEVEVERGQARVIPRANAVQPLILIAGQRWSSAQIEARPMATPSPRPSVARTVVERAPPEAVVVAPSPAEAEAEAEAEVPATPAAERWLAEADRLRLAGKHADAAELYRRIAVDPPSAPYAEEALFLRAQSLAALSDRRAALEALEDASVRFAAGALLPERTALASQLWLASGEPARAAELLESLGARSTLESLGARSTPPEDLGARSEGLGARSTSPAVLEARVHTAKAIAREDVERARRLLEPRDFLRAPPALAALADEARAEIEREK